MKSKSQFKRRRRAASLICGAAASTALAATASVVCAQTNNYFGTSGTLNGSVWSTNPNGPYTSALDTTGGAILNFGNTTTTVTGASVTIAGINVTSDVIGWLTGGSLTAVNNQLPITVSASKTLDLNQSIGAGTSITKEGAGTLVISYLFGSGGNLTLNAGVVVTRSSPTAGGNFTINGGTLAATGNRTYAISNMVIGGDFQLGAAATSFISGSATQGFTTNINLGSASRTITLGGTGTQTFTGVVSGGAGVGLSLTTTGVAGTLSFAGTTSNTYAGDTNVQAGTLTLNKTAGITAVAGNLIISGGTVSLSAADQIANTSAVSINSGTFGLAANNEAVASVLLNGGVITGTTGVLTSTSDFDLRSATGSVTAVLGGSVNVVKSTAGAVTLAPTTTVGGYTGATSITSGTLALNTAQALSMGTEFRLSGDGKLIINVKDADLSKLATFGVPTGTTLRLNQTQTLGSSPGTISGTLELGATNINPSNYGFVLGTGGRITNTASQGLATAVTIAGNSAIYDSQATTFTMSGAVNVTGNVSKTLTLTGSADGVLSGQILEGTSTLAIVKSGTGKWDVTNTANSFTGPIEINEGYLRFTGSGALISQGTGAGITLNNTTSNDAMLGITAGDTFVQQITVSSAGGGSGKSIFNNTTTNQITLNGLVTLNKTAYVRSTQGFIQFGSSIAPSGGITGTGALVVDGAPTVVIGLANSTWSGGLTISNGSSVQSQALVPQSPYVFGTGDIWLKSGGTLNYSTGGNYGYMQHGTIHIDAGDFGKIGWTSTTIRQQKINDIEIGSGTTGGTLTVNLSEAGAGGANVSSGQVRLFGDSVLEIRQGLINFITGGGNTAGRFNIAGGVAEASSVTTSSLIKTGNGQLVLGLSLAAVTGQVAPEVNLPAIVGVASTYKGSTSIASGSLEIGLDNAVPVGTTVYLAGGAMFNLGVTTTIPAVRANFNQQVTGLNDLSGTGGMVTGYNNNAANSGTIVGNRTLTLSGTGTYNFTGAIVDHPGNLTLANNKLTLSKTGSGTQTLSGANTYSGGTDLQNGVLVIGASGNGVSTNVTPLGVALASTTITTGATTISVVGAQASGVTVGMTMVGSRVTGMTVSSVSGDIVGLSGVTGGVAGAQTITFGNLSTATAASTTGLRVGQTISATGYAAGTQIMGINGNVLTLSSQNSGVANLTAMTGSAWSSLPTAGQVTFSGGTLRWGSGNNEDYSARFATSGNQQYKLDTGGNNVTLGTALASTGGSLAKYGAGTLTLQAANTYSGPTTVAGGTLALAASERIADTSDVVMAGGKLQTGGAVETVDTLSVADNSSIDFGNGSSTLAFTGGSGSLASGKTLFLLNWSGDAVNGSGTDQLYVGQDDSLALSGAVHTFVFVDPAGQSAGWYYATQLSSGEIVPTFESVPEPGMIGVMAVGGLALLRRRQRRRV